MYAQDHFCRIRFSVMSPDFRRNQFLLKIPIFKQSLNLWAENYRLSLVLVGLVFINVVGDVPAKFYFWDFSFEILS